MKSTILFFLFLSFNISFSQHQPIGKPIGTYSPAILVGNTLYISGQIGLHPDSSEINVDSIDQEIIQAIDNVGVILKQANFEFEDIVSVTIYMTDLEEYSTMSKVYKKYFPNKNYPSRTVVEISRLPRDAQFEISAIAIKK